MSTIPTDGYFDRLTAGEPTALTIASSAVAAVAIIVLPYMTVTMAGTLTFLEMSSTGALATMTAFAIAAGLIRLECHEWALLPAVFAGYVVFSHGVLVVSGEGVSSGFGWFVLALAVAGLLTAAVRGVRSEPPEEDETLPAGETSEPATTD